MLDDRVALVTGASRGIGKEIARTLGRSGMKVLMSSRSPAVEAAASELERENLWVKAYQADISRQADVDAMVTWVEDELGPLWLLVNNAGLLRNGGVEDLPEQSWDEMFAVNAKGVFLCSQAVLRQMIPRGGGRIVNISSIAGLIVRVGQIGYCAAKAATIHLSRCLAIEAAAYGITVNCICPGMTRTQMLLRSADEMGLDLEASLRLIPTGRMCEPEDIAHLVLYLASDDALQLTGQIISVDGGQSQYFPLIKFDGSKEQSAPSTPRGVGRRL